MTCETTFRWMSASCSHVGRVRQVNEDACLDQPERGLWAVADGMGGHTLGDVASNMVVASLNQLSAPASLTKYAAEAQDRLQSVNRQLLAEAALHDARIIGSTVVVLLAYEHHCTYLWAGDSRIYLYRNGRLRQLTRDHSQLEALKSSGMLGADEARQSTVRNLITRAVGAADTLELEEEIIEVMDGDMFLLCSDGLSNEVDEQQMASVLSAGNCRQASQTLMDMALAHGGRDNISVIVIRADDVYGTDKTVLNPSL